MTRILACVVSDSRKENVLGGLLGRIRRLNDYGFFYEGFFNEVNEVVDFRFDFASDNKL